MYLIIILRNIVSIFLLLLIIFQFFYNKSVRTFKIPLYFFYPNILCHLNKNFKILINKKKCKKKKSKLWV